ncbi:MAG: AI-2E family transporter [Nanoarchaeota archaeon]
MEENSFRKTLTIILIVGLLALSFIVLKPIVMDIIVGFILAFIFYPVYRFLFRFLKRANLSASIVTVILLLLIIIPIWLFTPILINQSFKFYVTAQKLDFVGLLHKISPSFFASEQFSSEVAGTIQSFIPKVANSVLNTFSSFILNLPNILLHILVVLFTFYFALRDKDKILEYVKSLSPFSKEVEEKIFRYSHDMTSSILYGQVVLGFVQGVVLSIGLFLFGVPNALLLSVVAMIVGVFPILGPMLVWVPVVIYLLINNRTFDAFGIFAFGIIASNIEHFYRSFFISRRLQIPSAIILIGMTGGIFVFGVLGLFLGPLILAYLLIILEVLRGGHKNFYSTLLKRD